MATATMNEVKAARYDNQDTCKSLLKLRVAMETESHKYSIHGKKVNSSDSADNCLGTMLLQGVRFNENKEEQPHTPPVPSSLPANTNLSVPPLRPHDLNWLLDEVPEFLEAGARFDSNEITSSPTRILQQASSTGPAETPPNGRQLANAFQALSSNSQKRKVSLEDLFAPLATTDGKQQLKSTHAIATSWKSDSLRLSNVPLPHLKKPKKESATTA